uniref:Putative lipase ROG1 isoform X4 n=1 Tax=Davidia involucrata TaxID=16924 RepID=A0A5B6ZLP0_DAVIN
MIAATIFPVVPANSLAKPTSICRYSGAVVCFNLGFGLKPGREKYKLSLDGNKMELIRKLSRGCFMDRPRKAQKVDFDSLNGSEDVFDAASAEAKLRPEHLIIMVNGIIGSAADWRYAADQLVKKLPDKVIVHRSECNSSRLTFDGVDRMGERLAEEVLDVVKLWPEVQKISFVAHSLGGLVARYAIGRLYELFPKMESSGIIGNGSGRDHSSNLTQCIEQHYKTRIAGLEPMNFITFATPHLGSRGHKQLPFLCGFPFLERRASQTAHWIVGRSGKHLFLTDNDDGRPPLLLRMVNDSDDLKFICGWVENIINPSSI